MSSEAAGIARRAAAEIQRRGLHKGAYMGEGPLDTCPVCLYGALNYVRMGAPDNEGWSDDPIRDDIVGPIPNRIGTFRLAQWNDRPETTAADVIALLNAVADDLDAQ